MLRDSHIPLSLGRVHHATLLRGGSFHPHHLKENIPHGQFQRLRHIYNQETDFAEAMSNRFSHGAYKPRVIKQAFDRQSLERGIQNIIHKPAHQSHPLFVTTYSTHAEQIKWLNVCIALTVYNVVQTKYLADVKTYTQSDFINGNNTFVIYCLSCPCVEGFFYIGCTKRRLRDRLAEHKYAIRT